MTRRELRQVHSLLREIEEEEERRYTNAAYSLFRDDCAVLDRYREQLSGIAAWIDQIDDSLTRRAFRLRYIDGMSWLRVSSRLGYSCPDGARKLCQRYLDAQEK